MAAKNQYIEIADIARFWYEYLFECNSEWQKLQPALHG